MSFLCYTTGIIIASMLFLVTGCTIPSSNPSYLRCDYRLDPLGTDSLEPHFSWTTESQKRCQKQTAYQILVADSKELLNKDRNRKRGV